MKAPARAWSRRPARVPTAQASPDVRIRTRSSSPTIDVRIAVLHQYGKSIAHELTCPTCLLKPDRPVGGSPSTGGGLVLDTGAHARACSGRHMQKSPASTPFDRADGPPSRTAYPLLRQGRAHSIPPCVLPPSYFHASPR